MAVNEAKLNDLLGTVLNELGASFNSILVLLGDKLGIYNKPVVIDEPGKTGNQVDVGSPVSGERHIIFMHDPRAGNPVQELLGAIVGDYLHLFPCGQHIRDSIQAAENRPA